MEDKKGLKLKISFGKAANDEGMEEMGETAKDAIAPGKIDSSIMMQNWPAIREAITKGDKQQALRLLDEAYGEESDEDKDMNDKAKGKSFRDEIKSKMGSEY